MKVSWNTSYHRIRIACMNWSSLGKEYIYASWSPLHFDFRWTFTPCLTLAFSSFLSSCASHILKKLSPLLEEIRGHPLKTEITTRGTPFAVFPVTWIQKSKTSLHLVLLDNGETHSLHSQGFQTCAAHSRHSHFSNKWFYLLLTLPRIYQATKRFKSI